LHGGRILPFRWHVGGTSMHGGQILRNHRLVGRVWIMHRRLLLSCWFVERHSRCLRGGLLYARGLLYRQSRHSMFCWSFLSRGIVERHASCLFFGHILPR
jgi:hypothetical protein